MGHAGAIINQSGTDSAASKTKKLTEAGVITANTLFDLLPLVAEFIKKEL